MSEKLKKSRKRRRDADVAGDDEEDGGVVAAAVQTPVTERKRKKKRQHSEVEEAEAAADVAAEEEVGATPASKRKKRKRRDIEWNSELDAQLLGSALPLVGKSTLAKRLKSSKSVEVDFSECLVEGFTLEQCNERLRLLEAIVKPIKTRHQILNEAMDMVKARSSTYVNKMFSDACPKRPQSAYMLFCKDFRDSIQTSGKPAEVMQVLAQRWKLLGDRDRTKYTKKASAEATRYDVEMAKFKEARPDLFVVKKAGGRQKKEIIGGPPPPRSALLLFKSDYVAKHSADSNAKEASGQAWKDLPPATKATWNEKWRAMVTAYRASLTSARPSLSPEDQEQVDALLEKHTITKTVKQVGYDLFAKTRRPELRAFHPKESLKEISTRLKVQWTALPDIDRQRYCQQATVLQDNP